MDMTSTSPSAIIVFILLMLIGPAIGMWSSRKVKNTVSTGESDMRFGAVVTGLSAAASGNSAFVMVGAVGLGFSMGVTALWIALGFWIGDFLFWYLAANRLVKRVQDERVDTIGELIARQIIGHTALVMKIVTAVIVLAIGLYCVAQFLAVSKVLATFAGTSIQVAIVISVVAGLMSVLLGGLGSSILVNVYQGVLMVISATIVVISTFYALTLSPEVLSAPTENVKDLLNPFSIFSGFALVMFVFAFILQGFLFAMSNPHVLTRITKGNVEQIPKVRWIYMGFMQTLWWLMTLVGVALAALNTAVNDPDQALIVFSQANFPAVIVGIVMAGIAAASLSTGEAQLLVISDAITKDMMPKFFNKQKIKTKRTVLILSRVLVAVAIIIVLLLADLDAVGQLIIQSAALVCAAFAIPVILFIFNQRVNGLFMAFLIVVGVFTTASVRVNGVFTGGEELIPGIAVLVSILGVRYLIRKVKPS